MTLDERFNDLKQAVDDEVARVRREMREEFARVLDRIRAAATDAERGAIICDFSGSTADLGAQRFARVKVAEIQLYQAAAVKTGRSARDVYGALQPHMDAAREAYREKYLTPVNETADYLHAEFVRTLANDDPTLLGPGYPGPLA